LFACFGVILSPRMKKRRVNSDHSTHAEGSHLLWSSRFSGGFRTNGLPQSGMLGRHSVPGSGFKRIG
jgi:hypothetical protein